ncbi:hypothetical protein DUNSADRAFT_3533 [Dunaliella salina]|uniref:Uncharacterized protein n=1 Tax=Dunaliella salina TaxID=3046 RepID=A0ABQ7H7V8_DUNSA|nr:hypothetical protein DUNSADRAFT_3533 [Dunaliella salina]|eukprot:KAF5842941.1 hypothetical protein DUNSADRAFT_3533 [Dunaliella salina]
MWAMNHVKAAVGTITIQALSRQDEGEMRKDFNVCLQKLAAGDVEEAVQVMKLFCYELMDQGSSNGAPVAALFQANMDQVVSILTQRSDEIFASACRCGGARRARNSHQFWRGSFCDAF